MNRETFDDYISRFNAEDATAFDDYLAPDMLMVNGALRFHGVAGMCDHYQSRIWPFFREKLNVLRFVSSDTILAVEMWTNFTARVGADTLLGKVVPGEMFDYRGLIMYDIAANSTFSGITVAYNSFVNTKPSGETVDIGMPH